jgi:hypothetical protein
MIEKVAGEKRDKKGKPKINNYQIKSITKKKTGKSEVTGEKYCSLLWIVSSYNPVSA